MKVWRALTEARSHSDTKGSGGVSFEAATRSASEANARVMSESEGCEDADTMNPSREPERAPLLVPVDQGD